MTVFSEFTEIFYKLIQLFWLNFFNELKYREKDKRMFEFNMAVTRHLNLKNHIDSVFKNILNHLNTKVFSMKYTLTTHAGKKIFKAVLFFIISQF